MEKSVTWLHTLKSLIFIWQQSFIIDFDTFFFRFTIVHIEVIDLKNDFITRQQNKKNKRERGGGGVPNPQEWRLNAEVRKSTNMRTEVKKTVPKGNSHLRYVLIFSCWDPAVEWKKYSNGVKQWFIDDNQTK